MGSTSREAHAREHAPLCPLPCRTLKSTRLRTLHGRAACLVRTWHPSSGLPRWWAPWAPGYLFGGGWLQYSGGLDRAGPLWRALSSCCTIHALVMLQTLPTSHPTHAPHLPPACSHPQAELAELERFFRYCSGLRERRPAPQRQYFKEVLGIAGKQAPGLSVLYVGRSSCRAVQGW